MLALDKVTRAEFQSVLEEDFELITGTGGITLKLIGVEPKDQTGERREPFTLTFRGAAALELPASLYRLQNTTLGAMELFLTQASSDDLGSRFQADFS